MTLGNIVCSVDDKSYYDKNYNLMLEVNHTREFHPQCIIAFAICALSAISFPHNTLADARYSTLSNDFNHQSPVDFSLSFSGTDIDLISSELPYSINQSRISLNIVNRVSGNLNVGLIIGSNYLSQDNDAVTAGLSMNGSHIGLTINGIFGDNLQLGLRASYIYQHAKGGNTSRVATLTSHEWLTEATLRLRLGTRWALIAGTGLMGLEVDRRVSGDINETIRMKLDDNIHRKLAIELLTAPSDLIRLTVNRGAIDNFQLTFTHAF